MRPAREFAIVTGAAAVGAGAVLLACGRAWVNVRLAVQGLPNTEQTVDGRTLAPACFALALAALAGVVGLVATRGWARRVVAIVVACCGAGAALSAWLATAGTVRFALPVPAAGEPVRAEFTAWPWVAVGGALLVVVLGVVTAVRGSRWPGMGRKYDAPRAAVDGETDMWRTLDHGEDPTT